MPCASTLPFLPREAPARGWRALSTPLRSGASSRRVAVASSDIAAKRYSAQTHSHLSSSGRSYPTTQNLQLWTCGLPKLGGREKKFARAGNLPVIDKTRSMAEAEAATASAAEVAAEVQRRQEMRLQRQEVVNLLDSIPTFNIVTIADTRIVGTVDGEEADEGECVRFFTDPDEAGSALVVAQLKKPDVPLRLAVTPLGTAFALSQGWQETPPGIKLRLQASKILRL